MSGKEVEPITGEHDQYVIQGTMFPPHLGMLINTPDAKNELTPGEVVLFKEDEYTRVRIRISEFERLLPWLDAKAAGLKYFPIEYGDHGMESRAIGTKLHQIDTLFSLVAQKVTTEDEVRGLLPSFKDKERIPYQHASLGAPMITIGASLPELKQIFEEAWDIFYEESHKDVSGNEVLLEGMGLDNPGKIAEILHSPKMYDEGKKFAHAWAVAYWEEQQKPDIDTMSIWELAKDNVTQREVTVVWNLNNGLQIRGRFDSITRRPADHKKVTTQLLDLKTGNSDNISFSPGSVSRRQEQLMLIMAEHFTAKYVKKNENIIKPRSGFIINADYNKIVASGRSHFAYKFYDRAKGILLLRHVSMTPEERLECMEWLGIIGKQVSENKLAVMRLLGRKIKERKGRKIKRAKKFFTIKLG